MKYIIRFYGNYINKIQKCLQWDFDFRDKLLTLMGMDTQLVVAKILISKRTLKLLLFSL